MLQEYLLQAIEEGASDIFVVAGSPVSFRKDSLVVPAAGEPLRPEDTKAIVGEVYRLAQRPMQQMENAGEDDFSFSLPGKGRFRANAFHQRGTQAVVIRVLSFTLPDPAALMIPGAVLELADTTKGLVLVTGPAGSGKSTTLACMVDRINTTRAAHIITMEDPIEFIHRHKKGLVTQREIGGDTKSYAQALRAGLRQSPDVLLVGEMRDLETIEIALTAAETGQFVMSTLHTLGAANTIDRILDIFPAGKQAQIRVQLSMVLRAVISQQLIPSVSGVLVPAFEIMVLTPAIRNMVREARIHQIDSAIFSGGELGMVTMDQSILALYKQGVITAEAALRYSVNWEEMERKLALG